MQFVSAQSNADIYFYEVRDTFAEKQNQNHATLPEAKVERSQAANGKYLKIQYQKKRLDFNKKKTEETYPFYRQTKIRARFYVGRIENKKVDKDTAGQNIEARGCKSPGCMVIKLLKGFIDSQYVEEFLDVE